MDSRSGAKFDIVLPSPASIAQAKQVTATSKSPPTTSHSQVARVAHTFKVGIPCYALYCGPRQNKDSRWVPAMVTTLFGPRSVNVHVFPHGATWRVPLWLPKGFQSWRASCLCDFLTGFSITTIFYGPPTCRVRYA